MSQVEPAVVVGVEEGDPEAEQVRGSGRPGRSAPVWSVKMPCAEVLVEGRRLVVEVGDGQVGPAVAVEVAAGDPHARLVAAGGVGGDPGGVADLLEPEPAQVAEEEVGRLVVGDEEVDPAVVVEVGGDDAQAAAVGVDDPGLAVTSTNRPPSLRKRWSGSEAKSRGLQ